MGGVNYKILFASPEYKRILADPCGKIEEYEYLFGVDHKTLSRGAILGKGGIGQAVDVDITQRINAKHASIGRVMGYLMLRLGIHNRQDQDPYNGFLFWDSLKRDERSLRHIEETISLADFMVVFETYANAARKNALEHPDGFDPEQKDIKNMLRIRDPFKVAEDSLACRLDFMTEDVYPITSQTYEGVDDEGNVVSIERTYTNTAEAIIERLLFYDQQIEAPEERNAQSRIEQFIRKAEKEYFPQQMKASQDTKSYDSVVAELEEFHRTMQKYLEPGAETTKVLDIDPIAIPPKQVELPPSKNSDQSAIDTAILSNPNQPLDESFYLEVLEETPQSKYLAHRLEKGELTIVASTPTNDIIKITLPREAYLRLFQEMADAPTPTEIEDPLDASDLAPEITLTHHPNPDDPPFPDDLLGGLQ